MTRAEITELATLNDRDLAFACGLLLAGEPDDFVRGFVAGCARSLKPRAKYSAVPTTREAHRE